MSDIENFILAITIPLIGLSIASFYMVKNIKITGPPVDGIYEPSHVHHAKKYNDKIKFETEYNIPENIRLRNTGQRYPVNKYRYSHPSDYAGNSHLSRWTFGSYRY